MRTRLSICTARSSASLRDSPSCKRSTSAICSPTVYTGLSDVIGSWKTIAISLARIFRISSGGSGTRSRPCHSTRPATILPGGIGTSLSTVIAVTDLPQPDSPTTHTVSRRSTLRSTPSTACNQPSSVLKWVLSPWISSNAILSAPPAIGANRIARRSASRAAATEPAWPGRWRRRPGVEATEGRSGGKSYHPARIECVAQAIADEVDGQHGEENRRARKQRPMRRDIHVILRVVQQPAPGGDVRREAQAEERQGRLGDDRRRDV